MTVYEVSALGQTYTRPAIRELFSLLRRHKLAMLGLFIILGLAIVAIFAPLIAPHDPTVQNLSLRLMSPSWEYPMGTDSVGRCVLSRLIYGTRVSLQVGVTVVLITSVTGTALGLIAGYFSGIVDEIIMRIVDILLSFPGLILALVVVGVLGPGLQNVLLALSVVGWMQYARVVRGVAMSAKEKDFVTAARALGASNRYILLRHIMPEALPHVIVLATLNAGGVILAAAALSFLGLGIEPPTPEWGAMLNTGRAYIYNAPHLTIFPGVAIMLTVLAFNFLGDGLRDALDPKQKSGLGI